MGFGLRATFLSYSPLPPLPAADFVRLILYPGIRPRRVPANLTRHPLI